MKLHVIGGPNFSGRTHYLREWVGLPNNINTEPVCNNCAYIGPDPATSLSGIAPTVEAELMLMAADRDAVTEARKAMDDLGFGYCLDQNPFTLSGGEQVVAAVLAATVGRPRRLAIDCAFEQLSADTRTNMLTYLKQLDLDLMIADNRLDEWHSIPTETLPSVPNSPSIRPDVYLKIVQEPCEIELIDICHYYVKGRMVLNNLNLKLEEGITHQLMGPNGSGKTTLSKILSGLIKPTSGEIRINGKVVQPWKNPGMSVSYHFQSPDFQLFSSSVREQMPQTEGSNTLAMWFGLEKHVNDHPLDLPFVLKKRVALASAIQRKAGFLILDEPSLSQDHFSSQSIVRLIATGVSGLIISHSRLFSDFPSIRL